MRLSEAIRKGCEGTQQFFGNFGNDDSSELCALGAALRAVGGEFSGDGLLAHFSQFFKMDAVICPACEKNIIAFSFLENVSHLNDRHHWTREQIADWVQLQEAILDGICQDECHGPTGPCVRELGHEGDHVRPEPVLA